MKPKLLAITLSIFLNTNCNPKVTSLTARDPLSISTQKSTLTPFSVDELERRTFNWFWDLIDKNYQVPDRTPTLQFSSIAATGFGLTAYCIGVERQYVTRKQAAERVKKTLDALWKMPQGEGKTGISGYKGLFYHFLDNDRSERFKEIELSTIDTGLLMAGVLSVMSYFDQDNPIENDIRERADALFRRVEWDWCLNKDKTQISMGYHPETGFIKQGWAGYNEAMVLVIMAIGSPTHAVPPQCWQEWCKTYPWATFEGQEHVNFDPLFGHQYSHMYVDFRGIYDDYMSKKGIDYFENARRATLANRSYCVKNPNQYANYNANEWGLTACDGPKDTITIFNGKNHKFWGYSARGAASTQIVDDGTIAPTAAGGSIPFLPELCLSALENMWNKYNGTLVQKYGFKDAFNPTYTFGKGNEQGWVDVDYLGIDQGPILIQLENYRSEFVWKLMKKNPYIVAGLKKAGFKGGWLK